MLFHPFATPSGILEGVDFLYQTAELHRFGVILERTRLVPGTMLLAQVEDADLVTDRNYQVLRCAYRFSDVETGRLYNRFQSCFAAIGVPLLERIEHLFVTGEFIDNMVHRVGRPRRSYESYPDDLRRLRRCYSEKFRALCLSLADSRAPNADAKLEFRRILNMVEHSWQRLLAAAELEGLDDPISWIPTGDLRPESSRPLCYNGSRATTRSGTIEV